MTMGDPVMRDATRRVSRIIGAAAIAAGAALFSPAHGQTGHPFPTAPIKIIVPSAPGGLSDPIVRFLGERLRSAWGQPVVMEHRPGGGGILGTQLLINSAPDGHTLMLGNAGGQLFTPLLNSKTPYVVDRDLMPVSTPFTFANVLIVNPSVKANNVRELIQLARQSPGAIQFASSGIGQSHHLSGELFKKMAGVDIVHVPYKGSGPAAADLIGGHVQMMFANIPAALPLIEAGRARALAITGKTRSASLPNLPTVDEAGVPGYSVVSFVGLFAPAATPRPIIDKLTEEVNKAFTTAEGQKLLQSMNIDWSRGSPDDFRSFLRTETTKWAALIKEANIKVE